MSKRRWGFSRWTTDQPISQAEAEQALERGMRVTVEDDSEGGFKAVVYHGSCFYFCDRISGQALTQAAHRSPHAAIEAAKKALRERRGN